MLAVFAHVVVGSIASTKDVLVLENIHIVRLAVMFFMGVVRDLSVHRNVGGKAILNVSKHMIVENINVGAAIR